MTPKAGHTAGRVEFIDGFLRAKGGPLKVVGVQIPCVVGPSRLEAIHNSMFIAEAFTVAHETGLTPRQLADRCEKLEAALAFTYADPCFTLLGSVTKDEVSATLAKATAGGAV